MMPAMTPWMRAPCAEPKAKMATTTAALSVAVMMLLRMLFHSLRSRSLFPGA